MEYTTTKKTEKDILYIFKCPLHITSFIKSSVHDIKIPFENKNE